MVFHWSLRDNKSPRVSRTLLRILADLNDAVFGLSPVVFWFLILPILAFGECPKRTSYYWYHRQLHVTLFLLLLFTYWVFFTSVLADGFSLESVWLVSKSLLFILTDLNNAVVWKVSTRSLIYKSSTSCINPLVTLPSVYNYYYYYYLLLESFSHQF